jgi:ParB family chromosome partitioning protein
MTLKLVSIPVELCDYASQPRSHKRVGYIESLAANIKANGQKVPVIGWMESIRFQLADGGCRLEAIRLAGLTHVLALDLGKEPSKIDLLVAQASIDLHKQHLPPVDRARLYQSIQAEQGANGKETAEAVGISPSMLTRYLYLLNLAPDLQALVNSEELEWTKASLIGQATADPDAQRELMQAAKGMTRDALAASLRKQQKPESAGNDVRVRRLTVPLGLDGQSMTITGGNLTLDDAIAVLQQTLKSAKKARSEKLDVKTWVAVMRDRNKGERDVLETEKTEIG